MVRIREFECPSDGYRVDVCACEAYRCPICGRYLEPSERAVSGRGRKVDA